jgi:hypothetical protein
MASDWIKMRNDLPEDPNVFKLSSMTKLDRFAVVGRLYAFWSWADKHAVDGRVDGASSTVVDDITRQDGFADALAAVKWLEIGDDYVAIPKHDRHNGESAKERSLKNARQARWRDAKSKESPTDVDDEASTQASTDASTRREEKRREERATSADAAGGKKGVKSKNEDFECARWLFGAILKVNQTAKAPNFETWAKDVRLMNEVDGRSHREICELFQFAKSDSFWSPNIQSPAKLREKWDMLTEKRAQSLPAPAAPKKKDWE